MTTDDSIDWRLEARTAALVAAFAAMLGSIVGVIWHAVAPRIHIVAATNGSAAAMKPLIGDDVWIGGLGLIAGALCVLVLMLAAPKASRGPGAQIGLAVGGVLGMLVADRVGYLIGHHDLTNAIHAGFPTGDARFVHVVLGYFDFKVRAVGVMLAWPLASVIFSTLANWLRLLKEPTTPIAAPYSVSP